MLSSCGIFISWLHKFFWLVIKNLMGNINFIWILMKDKLINLNMSVHIQTVISFILKTTGMWTFFVICVIRILNKIIVYIYISCVRALLDKVANLCENKQMLCLCSFCYFKENYMLLWCCGLCLLLSKVTIILSWKSFIIYQV